MKARRLTTAIVLPLLMILFLEKTLVSGSATQLVLTVDSELDEIDALPGDGLCQTESGFCTLRAAVQEANAVMGEDLILLPAATISLTLEPAISSIEEEQDTAAGDLDVSDPLRISGVNSDVSIIDGNNLDRVFQVLTETSLFITDVAIWNGTVYGRFGGSILNQGILSMTRSTIQDSFVDFGSGGALFNTGILTLTDVLLAENDASDVLGGGSAGGGLANAGRAYVFASTFYGNRSGNGPAIYNRADAWIQIESSTIEHNIGYGSRFTGGPSGGGIKNLGNMHINQSLVFSNTASAVFWTEDDGYGGGIYSSGDSSVSIVTNSTIAANLAAYGGGIWAASGAVVTLTHNTVAFNSATRRGHNLATGDTNSTIFVHGSIVNGATISCENNIVSQGYNIESGDSCSFVAASDQVQTNPMLTPLGHYGGSTMSYGLLFLSPAIDAAANSRCPAVDQRDARRPVDGDKDGKAVCDIGSFEYEPGPVIFLPLVRER